MATLSETNMFSIQHPEHPQRNLIPISYLYLIRSHITVVEVAYLSKAFPFAAYLEQIGAVYQKTITINRKIMGKRISILHIAECAGGVERYLQMLLFISTLIKCLILFTLHEVFNRYKLT